MGKAWAYRGRVNILIIFESVKNRELALTSVAQLTGRHSEKPKFAGSIPSQGYKPGLQVHPI